MGSDRIFTCKDCRYSAHLGDSGGMGWRLVDTNERDVDILGEILENNRDLRWAGSYKYVELIREHGEHDWFVWSSDSCHFVGNDLFITGAGWVPDKLLHKDVNFGMEALNEQG